MLYGDGVRSDREGIQALLDSGASAVVLPPPEVCYLLDGTLRIHSGQTLRLEATSVIRLMPGSDCFMLVNSPEDGSHDVCVEGGIWDFDNTHQSPNPWRSGLRDGLPSHMDGDPRTVVTYTDGYFGSIMRFRGVTRLTLRGITYKDPVTYCLHMAETRYFTVEDIRFDMNYGNPAPINMDGVHIDGGCEFGFIHNVQGTCYDDVVALNADDGYDGPISDVVIDGVFADNALRGVRILSTKSPVRRISIRNVFGTYYQNAILIGYYYPFSGVRGSFGDIAIQNEFASQAERLPVYGKRPEYEFALIDVQGPVDVRSLRIDCAHRREEHGDLEMVRVEPGADVGTLSLNGMSQENLTGKEFPMISVQGHVGKLILGDLDAGGGEVLRVTGTVDRILRPTE